ncbi:MAG TPA: DUF488 domain-containing protein [Candidatus Jeotgalibaca pullicola]|nr:DUF488 domain-containing protein [Candidatus Jeotgalibaca pullicola]
MGDLKIKRVYEDYEKEDGTRILIDRLWPRGVKKEDAKIDKWIKEIAPTPELRKWFHKDIERFYEFKERYRKELTNNEETSSAVTEVLENLQEDDVTLIFAAKDEQRNHAKVLQEFLEEKR